MSARRWNELQWNGASGHYEVYYLTLTDPQTGVGFWIRWTMVAPRPETGEEATCSVWFLAMDPHDPGQSIGLKSSFPVSRLSATAEPFRLEVADSWLSDHGATGSVEQDGRSASWELRWEPSLPAYGHVHPALRAARIAKTVLFLPHPDLAVSGWIEWQGRRIPIDGARGGQAHLWGSKHAQRWAWAHCNDFADADGQPRPGGFVGGVSVFVPRFGRTIGPNTPVVARIGGVDVLSTGPLSVTRNKSEFELTGWRFEARAGKRRLRGEVTARTEDLLGVTYHDPDGDLAYCYNTEVASMTLELLERADRSGWRTVDSLRSDGRAHFEYAQREPLPGVRLDIR
jgi:tocopherol cyclase-like protein